MAIFETHVLPRIERAEHEIGIVRTRKIPYAIARDDFNRVSRLAERATELQQTLEQLRALEGFSDARIVDALAAL